MGEKKVALFCCIPDADTSLNYLVGMIYTQLFQTLYYVADRICREAGAGCESGKTGSGQIDAGDCRESGESCVGGGAV